MRDVTCAHCGEETVETDRRTERLGWPDRWAEGCPRCGVAAGEPCNTTSPAVARAGYVHDERPVPALATPRAIREGADDV